MVLSFPLLSCELSVSVKETPIEKEPTNRQGRVCFFVSTLADFLICDGLHDLVPFVQFKKREKHPWRSTTFIKVAVFKPATLMKVALLHGYFSRFLNCMKGTKSRNASHMYNAMFIIIAFPDFVLYFIIVYGRSSGAYSESCQTHKIERFVLTIFTKHLILDVK